MCFLLFFCLFLGRKKEIRHIFLKIYPQQVPKAVSVSRVRKPSPRPQ